MEFFRTDQNPWGEQVLLGVAWNVAWLVVAAGVLFIVVHAWFARRDRGAAPARKHADAAAAGVPERIVRHGRSARVSHWALAAATLTLLITAFVPMLGLEFPWVTVHWVAGVVLSAYVVYHTVDTLARRSWSGMWIGARDVVESFSRLGDFFAHREGDAAKRPGKWGIENKFFHHLTAVAGLAVAVTGILMMARLDTWFWDANPYFRDIPDSTWGIVFVIHGFAALAFVGLLMAHIYFALRPDKLWFTRSMFKGWITGDEYLGHFNPQRWLVTRPGLAPAPEPVGAPVAAAAAAGTSATSEAAGAVSGASSKAAASPVSGASSLTGTRE